MMRDDAHFGARPARVDQLSLGRQAKDVNGLSDDLPAARKGPFLWVLSAR